MTLLEHLGTPQAREDVRRLLATVEHRHIDIVVADMPGSMSLYRAGVWTRCVVMAQTFMRPADPQDGGCCFRPEGDRFIVSDLGEGFKAACLRGFDWLNPEHMAKLMALAATFPDGMQRDAPLGTLERRDVSAAGLPGAICRVMLASLNVAGVQV